MQVTKSLQDTVERYPHIEEVYFSADGNHHFRAFDCNGKKYARLHQVPEETKSGIVTSKMILAPIKNNKNQDDERFLITETMSRADVLSATAVADKSESAIKKAEILDILGISDDDLAKILKSKSK